jgi:hypothetical protein
MPRKASLPVFLMLLAITSSRPTPLAQAAPQNRGAQQAKVQTTPCLVNRNSIECATYRLNGVDESLAALQNSITLLQSRPTGTLLSGPTIQKVVPPKNRGKADDPNTDYILQRLDQLTTVVNQLVDRLNGAK